MLLAEKLNQLALPQPIAIIGAGVTGRSVFDLLKLVDIDSVILDEAPEYSGHFTHTDAKIINQKLSAEALKSYKTLIVSPGVDLRRPVFNTVLERVINDTELFGRLATKPVIGVTGSNGKSTVVSLLAHVMRLAGKKVALCGNIGEGLLSALLKEDEIDFYVAELSSYQLERAPSLEMKIGVLLNITPDHLDRYNHYDDYIAAKLNILTQSHHQIVNGDEKTIPEKLRINVNTTTFSTDKTADVNYGAEKIYIDHEAIFAMQDFSSVGKHNAANVAAVFAIAKYLSINLNVVAEACKTFKGLPSRFVSVAEIDQILYINDSKATNVGATVAAIEGLSRPIILLAGGQGKAQDFSPLVAASRNKVKQLIVFGEEKDKLKALFDSTIPVLKVSTLAEAFTQAVRLAESGDVVLLSPACASFDQFPNYLVRGEYFEQYVHEHEKQC